METRTRSKTRSRPQSQEDVQVRKITDNFSVTRRGITAATKGVKEQIVQDVKPKISTKKKVKKEPVIVREPEPSPVPESPPRRPRKTPTPPSSPPREQPHPSARRLFQEEEIEETEKEAVSPPFGLQEKKTEVKKKSKINLQERLAASNPSLAKVHAQVAANKAKEVSQHADLLRSPAKAPPVPLSLSPAKKLAPVFFSPTKRPQTIKIGDLKKSPPQNVPEFVLPSHRTPAKQVDEEELGMAQMERNRLFEAGHKARLYEVVKKNQEIELPTKYQNLLRKFHTCDRIVSIFVGRGSRCEVSQIFRNVSKNDGEFTRTHLAQIMAVYPKSYNLKLEEQRSIAGHQTGRFDLVMEPNIIDDLANFMRPESPKKVPSEPIPMVIPGPCLSPMKSPRKKVVAALPREAEIDHRPKLEGWRMLNRKYVFKHLLAERVKKCEERFLQKIGVEPENALRLHPSFSAQINNECDDIEQAPLPESKRKEANFTKIEEFMKSVKEPETSVDTAIKELSNGEEVSSSRNIPLSPKKFAQLAASRPNGTRNLLEKIRAKEALKRAAEAQRDPEAERQYFLLELLHTKIIRPLLNLFIQKPARSIQLNLLLEKLNYSTKRSTTELKESIEFMCATAPNFSRIVEVVGSKYLQVEQTGHEEIRQAVKKALESTPKPLNGLKSR